MADPALIEAREVLAKMIFREGFINWERSYERADEILAALRTAGMALVPVEPTPLMVAAGTSAIFDNPPDGQTVGSTAGDCYRAMLAATGEK